MRTANDRFKDVSVAVAEGYAPIPCASGIDGGAMGVHYVSEELLKADAIDIAHPQAVMYEPGPDGKMALIAVEYIASKGPAALQGQLFNFMGAPNRYGLGPFYELHVWAWKSNPRGAFADMNPDVTCEHAHPMSHQAHVTACGWHRGAAFSSTLEGRGTISEMACARTTRAMTKQLVENGRVSLGLRQPIRPR